MKPPCRVVLTHICLSDREDPPACPPSWTLPVPPQGGKPPPEGSWLLPTAPQEQSNGVGRWRRCGLTGEPRGGRGQGWVGRAQTGSGHVGTEGEWSEARRRGWGGGAQRCRSYVGREEGRDERRTDPPLERRKSRRRRWRDGNISWTSERCSCWGQSRHADWRHIRQSIWPIVSYETHQLEPRRHGHNIIVFVNNNWCLIRPDITISSEWSITVISSEFISSVCFICTLSTVICWGFS